MFYLVDRDTKSDFYFKITKQESRAGKLVYLLDYKPKNKDKVDANSLWLTLESIPAHLEKWFGLLKAYNSIHTVYDDPITKSNQERFEKQFEILDEDADTATFDLQQQLYLDNYLDNVKTKLIKLKEGRPENESKVLDEIAEEATEIQVKLTKETKSQIIKRLSRLWARAQKLGLEVIKEIFVNVAVEIAKKLLG